MALRSGAEERRVSFVCPQQAPFDSEHAGLGAGEEGSTELSQGLTV